MYTIKEEIREYVGGFVAEYMKRDDVHTVWGEPIVGFARADHPMIMGLKDLLGDHHALPQDVMSDARIVICYYVPFTKDTAISNRKTGLTAAESGLELASPEWARAYEETNAMFGELNSALIKLLAERGYHGQVPAAASVFDRDNLVSDWSQRSFAYAAGLGTFGINNMLITRHGCCGRYNSLVTNLDIEADVPVNEDSDPAKEYCLYKKNGSCGVCVKNCPAGALHEAADGVEYDRHRCYKLCMENAAVYTEFGNSYAGDTGSSEDSGEIVGSEVCGKCVTGSPCAFWNI